MNKFMDLGTLVLLIMIATGIITILYRLFQMKKNDGKVDKDEREELFQQVRNMALELVKEALEIQKQQEQGDLFVREYVISKLTILISDSTHLTQPEKDIIITYLLEEAVDTVLKMIGYDVVKIKKEAAQMVNLHSKAVKCVADEVMPVMTTELKAFNPKIYDDVFYNAVTNVIPAKLDNILEMLSKKTNYDNI